MMLQDAAAGCGLVTSATIRHKVIQQQEESETSGEKLEQKSRERIG